MESFAFEIKSQTFWKLERCKSLDLTECVRGSALVDLKSIVIEQIIVPDHFTNSEVNCGFLTLLGFRIISFELKFI